ncbi:MAG: Ig-like domain-containing protein [Bacteroidetes bacterium]|nr:Ig-like domain-containing protein [Bacteroidota bacterium]
MQKTNIYFCILCLAATLLLIRCANPVSPQGGPKDLKPPKVLACDPFSNSILFAEKSFRIDFDEFLALKNPVNEIYISPPLRKPLDTRVRGKSLVVLFDDTLSANTTYSITFGNAITDLTENNILKGFNYVFSTGSYIDSLSLQGTLVSAFDHTPQKDIFIGIYIDNNDTIAFDSLPLYVPPYYITKTDEKGQFVFNNLQKKKCKLLALADQNGDLIFNQPSEKIAFLDSLVEPFYMEIKSADTLVAVDSTKKSDTVKPVQPVYPTFELFLFEQTDSAQRLVKSTFPPQGMALLIFRFPVEKLQLTPLNFDSIKPWRLTEFSTKRDSVTLWITRPATDSITLRIAAEKLTTDTVDLAWVKTEKKQKKDMPVAEERLSIVSPSSGFSLNQFKNKLVLAWSFPLSSADFKRVLLIEDKDTIHPSIEYADSLHRKIRINYLWKEEKNYKLIFPDSTFYGLNGITQDTLLLNFKTKAEKDFGNLILSVNLPAFKGNYIIQLTNEKETVLFEEQIISEPGKIRFDFIIPGKYKIKAIKDRNKNGRWDSGNYNRMIQPEEVLYLPKMVEIRSNWDVEETWN